MSRELTISLSGKLVLRKTYIKDFANIVRAIKRTEFKPAVTVVSFDVEDNSSLPKAIGLDT